MQTIEELSQGAPEGLIHGDIKQEHILIDPKNLKITGLLDFANVSI